jgi:hypothetical protein
MASFDPERDEQVRVVVPRVGTLYARVVRVVPGAAELMLSPGSPVTARALHRHTAVVMPDGHGEGRLDGTLLAVADQGGRLRDDLVHFLQSVVALRRPSPPQRRDFARVDFARPLTMVPEGARVTRLDGFIRNLSAGGLLVAGAGKLDLGRRLRVHFALGDDEVDAHGRIVRADDEWGLRGVRLEELDAPTHAHLARFVTERQRRALAQLRARAG